MLKIKETCPDNVIKVLVGNKMDLEDDRKVLYEQAAEEVLLKGI
jgi:GTPase SAR1 family protein